MTPERHSRIGELFHAVLGLGADERAAFLERECVGDTELRREVEALVRSHEGGGGVIDRPALDVAAELLARGGAEEVVGRMLAGRYRVISLLGEGGMGRVYLAEDPRLGRKVALKLLPPRLTADAEGVRRFEREARAASALSHPNIITVYDITEADGASVIASEYIEGETLRERLTRGPLAPPEAVEIAVQVASALRAAHEAGIVHRDVKPENVMLRTLDGGTEQAKLIDFGIAKLAPQPAAELNGQNGSAVRTQPGLIMGTDRYMSPEQARGQEVDARADVWSLGCVLYEMLSGAPPFNGETAGDVVAAVLKAEAAPLPQVAPGTPAELQRIVGRCLEKDRELRYASAEELLDDLRRLRKRLDARDDGGARPRRFGLSALPGALLSPRRRKALALAAFAALVLVTPAIWLYWRGTNLRWAQDSLGRVEELTRAQRYFEAYDLAVQVEKYLPRDPTLARLMPTIADELSVSTEPEGARVYLKRFAPGRPGDSPRRQLIGTTPIDKLRIARGDYVLYLEKESYAPVTRTISGAPSLFGERLQIPPPVEVKVKLIGAAELPDRMVFVPGGKYRLVSNQRPTDEEAALDDFFIDKYEVSNREYKEFITAGGYLKKQFWKYPFVKEGRQLSWEEATRQFKDRTGLPGPRSWSNQDFPEGKADHPVTDITWYEAAAYAEFRGKKLPTLFQWEKAARDGKFTAFVSAMPWGPLQATGELAYRANFNGQGTVPVDSLEFGIGPFGCHHMAGNVAEWCLNETAEGFAEAGGAWNDPPYQFGYLGSFPGLYSSNKLGFRCALDSPQAKGDQGGRRIDAQREVPVFRPTGEAEFRAWLSHYRYDKVPLEATVEEVTETAEWRREKVSYVGAEDDRAVAYLWLPKNFPRPLEVIQYVPASDVFSGARSLPEHVELYMPPFIKSGRAVFAVVFKGFNERPWPPDHKPAPETSVKYREEMVSRATDLRRGLDYLETRDDLDHGRVAYCGLSAGALMGLVFTAVEPRYRSVVLMSDGLRPDWSDWIAEANGANFAPHITAPKLMLNGRYDEFFPWKLYAEPLYKLLREPKRVVLFDGGHAPPLEVAVPVTNTWLDETLGPVKRE